MPKALNKGAITVNNIPIRRTKPNILTDLRFLFIRCLWLIKAE